MAAAEYDRFAVVAFATPAILNAVEEIRRQVPPSGRPILPAHVTIKGTFVEPLDLEKIADRIRRCCAEAVPFTLSTGAVRAWTDDAYGAIYLRPGHNSSAVLPEGSTTRGTVVCSPNLGRTGLRGGAPHIW